MSNPVSIYNKQRLEALSSWLPAPLDKISQGKIDDFVDSLVLEDLRKFLISWIETQKDPLPSDMGVDNGETCVVDSRFYPSVSMLTKLCLYAGCAVVADPLLEHALGRMLVYNQIALRTPDVKEVADGIRRGLHFYKENFYALTKGVVLPTPFYAIEAASMMLPGYLAAGQDDLQKILPGVPEEILSVFEAAAKIYPYDHRTGTIKKGQPIPLEDATIVVEFDDHASPYDVMALQHYLKIDGWTVSRDGYLQHVRHTPPVTAEEMEQWKKNSVRVVAASRLYELHENFLFADRVGGSIFTSSSVHHAVLRSLDSTRQNHEVDILGNLNLPFLEGLTLENIVRAREDSALFQDFRIGFRDACGMVKSPSDDPLRGKELLALREKVFDQAARRLSEEMRILNKESLLTGAQAAVGAGTTVAVIAAVAQLGGVALAGPLGGVAAGMVAGGAKRWIGQMKLRNSSCAYFLWKLDKGRK